MKLHIFICGLTVLAFGCNNTSLDSKVKVEDVKLKGQAYTCTEIGWNITVPKDWGMVTADDLKKEAKKGEDALEAQAGKSVDLNGLRYILSFKKDKFNFLSSSIQPSTDDSVQYLQAEKSVDTLLFSAYRANNISADTSSGTVIIDGLRFGAFYVTINNPNGGILLQQVLYSRLINGYDFGVSINYNDDSCKTVMLNAFMNSKFDHTKK